MSTEPASIAYRRGVGEDQLCSSLKPESRECGAEALVRFAKLVVDVNREYVRSRRCEQECRTTAIATDLDDPRGAREPVDEPEKVGCLVEHEPRRRMVQDVRGEEPEAIFEPADPTKISREGLADETLGSDLIGEVVQRHPQDLGVLEHDRECPSSEARPPRSLQPTPSEATKSGSWAPKWARADAKSAVFLWGRHRQCYAL